MKNVDFLIGMNCKLIVVACNTATTNAIQELRTDYKIPFVGIEPAIKPAAKNSKTQVIGILATKGTLNSELFNKRFVTNEIREAMRAYVWTRDSSQAVRVSP